MEMFNFKVIAKEHRLFKAFNQQQIKSNLAL